MYAGRLLGLKMSFVVTAFRFRVGMGEGEVVGVGEPAGAWVLFIVGAML